MRFIYVGLTHSAAADGAAGGGAIVAMRPYQEVRLGSAIVQPATRGREPLPDGLEIEVDGEHVRLIRVTEGARDHPRISATAAVNVDGAMRRSAPTWDSPTARQRDLLISRLQA